MWSAAPCGSRRMHSSEHAFTSKGHTSVPTHAEIQTWARPVLRSDVPQTLHAAIRSAPNNPGGRLSRSRPVVEATGGWSSGNGGLILKLPYSERVLTEVDFSLRQRVSS